MKLTFFHWTFIRHVTCHEDYTIDNKIAPVSNNSNKEKKEDENKKEELDNIFQFDVSTSALTLTTQFYSNISINESTVRDGDTILLGRGSVASTLTTIDTPSDTASNSYNNSNGSSNQATSSTIATTALTTQFGSSISINESTIHDGETILLGGVANTHATSNYNNNNRSSNQAQHFGSRSQSQSRSNSQSRSQSIGIQYQQAWPSVVTSAVDTNDSVLIHSSANTPNLSDSGLSVNA